MSQKAAFTKGESIFYPRKYFLIILVTSNLNHLEVDFKEQNEGETEEPMNLTFYDELILPQPNPLPKRKRGSREPLRLVYDYPYRQLLSKEFENKYSI